MKNYLDLLKDILDNGEEFLDRKCVFGRQLRFDLSEGKLPILTTKPISTHGLIDELLWFIRGSSDVKELIDKNIHIWDEWMLTKEDVDKYVIDKKIDKSQANPLMELIGSIGPVYGSNWRNVYTGIPQEVSLNRLASDKMEQLDALIKALEPNKKITYKGVAQHMFGNTIDQLQNIMVSLKEKPYSTRHVISTWLPENIPDETISPGFNVLEGKGSIAPSHLIQQYVVKPQKEEGGKLRLSLLVFDRTTNVASILPYSMISYAILLRMVAQCCDMDADEFIWSGGDLYLNLDQIEGVEKQLLREPKELQTLIINKEVKDIYSFKVEDFEILYYNPESAIY